MFGAISNFEFMRVHQGAILIIGNNYQLEYNDISKENQYEHEIAKDRVKSKIIWLIFVFINFYNF